jgi:ATP-dependent helicase/nuclease subunit A
LLIRTNRKPFSSKRPGSGAADARAPDKKAPLAADIGTAHHTFLQFVQLDQAGSLETLKAETQRLQSAGILTEAEVELLDLKALAAFWSSELGRKVRGQAQFVRRELAFTVRFEAGELVQFASQSTQSGLDGEYVVVQGVADLAVILPQEIWLIDFKTDEVRKNELQAKVDFYSTQLRIYAEALSRIYQRPVTQACLYFLRLSKGILVDRAHVPR